jgi:hypothetical protein
VDAWRPGSALTARKLNVLIGQLPPESATMTALRVATPEAAEKVAAGLDPAKAPWSQMEMLLASLIDAVRRVEWMYASVHAKSSPPRAPDPIIRPGVKATQRSTMTVAQYKAMTGQEPPLRLVQGAG